MPIAIVLPLGEIAKVHDGVLIGSYPFMDDTGYNTNLVIRSRDPNKLAAAKTAVEDMIRRIKATV